MLFYDVAEVWWESSAPLFGIAMSRSDLADKSAVRLGFVVTFGGTSRQRSVATLCYDETWRALISAINVVARIGEQCLGQAS